MDDPKWKRYQELHQMAEYYKSWQTFSERDYRTQKLLITLCDFLLKPYLDLKKEKENER